MTADEALQVQREHQGQIDLIISIVLLPGQRSGTQVALELRAVIP